MEQEYRASTGFKFIIGIISCAIIFPILYFLSKAHDLNIPLLLVFSFFLLIAVLLILDVVKRKITIGDKSILYVNLFSTKELSLTNIKGYRMNNKTIKIEPISETDDALIFSNYMNFEDSDALKVWVVENFKDLNDIDLEVDKQEFLKNSEYGFTEKDKLEKLQNSKQIAMVYNVIGVVLAASVFVFDTKQIGCYALLLYPVIGIIVLGANSLIKFLPSSKNSIYPHVFIGFSVPGLALYFKSSAYNLFEWSHYWILSLVVSGVAFGLLYIVTINKSVEKFKMDIIVMIVSVLMYGFGSVCASNCILDKSAEQLFSVTIQDHRIIHKDFNRYYLTLSDWRPNVVQDEVKVSREMYFNTVIGDTVVIKLKKGLLDIPWFVVSKK